MTAGALAVWTQGDTKAQGCRNSPVNPNPSWAIRAPSPLYAHFCSLFELNRVVKRCRCAGGSDSWERLRLWG